MFSLVCTISNQHWNTFPLILNMSTNMGRIWSQNGPKHVPKMGPTWADDGPIIKMGYIEPANEEERAQRDRRATM
jgi:hypothetical protein